MISYRPINENDIEILRVWKNANKDGFFYKDDITPQAQKEWFKEYLKRNARQEDFMFVVQYGDTSVGCMGYRIINNSRIDIYNFMLGNKEFEGKKVVSTAARMLWKYLENKYDMDITVKVLLSNPKTIDWYLKNKWSPLITFSDHVILKYEGVDD